MPPVTPAEAEELVRANVVALPHGAKGAGVAALMVATGKSRATVYRKLHEVTVRQKRKARSDKGRIALTLEEARTISAWIMDSFRKNNKRLRSIKQALRELRHAGMVSAERTDAVTGEITPLSDGAVSKALKVYGLHPDQLLRPSPSVAVQSLHPNHVWEIDASICVLYYLRNDEKSRGLRAMPADEFYKNKPRNLDRIAADRVWRYLVVDHYSGSLFCHYVMGAESGANLVEAFIRAVTPRTLAGQTDPFCGVPLLVYMDPGSANTGALFKNLARRLQVKFEAHAPGNARATGAVEKHHDIWEHYFESALRGEEINSLDDLNEAAAIVSRFFNFKETHSRHGRSRTDMWLTIKQDQKRIAPSMEVLRLLATHKPEERKVEPWPGPVVRFQGKVYDVSAIANVMIGEKLAITYSPYLEGHACVVTLDADGNEELIPVPEVVFNEAGFPVDAPVFGESFRSPADTILQTNRKLVERVAMGAETDDQAASARRAKLPAFAGRVSPLAEAKETILPTPMTKRGTDISVQATTAATQREARKLTHFEAGQWLTAQGVKMDATVYARLREWHAAGVPEDQLPTLKDRLTVRAGLRVVAGGGGAQ